MAEESIVPKGYFDQYTKSPQPLAKTQSFDSSSIMKRMGGGSSGGSSSMPVSGAAIAGHVLTVAADAHAQADAANAIKTKAPSQQVDMYGKPIYNLGGFLKHASTIQHKGYSADEYMNNISRGVEMGSESDPWGLGAFFGGLHEGWATARVDHELKNITARKRKAAYRNLRAAQRSYNQSMDSYNARQSAQSLYDNMLNQQQQRMNNVYSAIS